MHLTVCVTIMHLIIYNIHIYDGFATPVYPVMLNINLLSTWNRESIL